MAKRLNVRYGQGRDLLEAYWGYLASGGIILRHPDDDDLVEGQSVAVNVHIDATTSTHELTGRVVKRGPESHRTVIAFDQGGTSELLRAALDQMPVDVNADVRVVDDGGAEHPVRISNISHDGCTLRIPAQSGIGNTDVGTTLLVTTPGLEVSGCVVWALADERGVMFAFDESPGAEPAVDAYVSSLRSAESWSP